MSWFARSKPSVDEMLVTLAQCDIRLRKGGAAEAIRDSATPGNFELLLAAMGDLPFDPQTYEELEPYSDDVWHFDFEAIEDHGAYASIVRNYARIAGGDLSIGEVRDFVDIEGGLAWVELDTQGATARIDLKVDNDWADPQIFQELDNRLIASGSAKRYARHDLGQDCLFVCKTPAQIEALNKATGLGFERKFG